MTFPQTSPVVAVQNGQAYWRLFTELSSSGDIYESEQSARAFVIGPDSDIARVKVVYYDVQNPNIASEVIVSVDKPFIGRIDALGSQQYQSGDGARILISHADISVPVGDNPFRPPTANPSPLATIETVQPFIDLIQYINEVPSFIAPRTDKVYQFGQLTNITDDQQWFLVPFYGRRFGDVSVKTLGTTSGTTPAIDIFVYGINFSWIIADRSIGSDNGHHQEMLGQFHLNVPSLLAGVSNCVSVTNQSFDYLAVQIQKEPGSANYPIESCVTLRIATSDKI
jgi:hypothetical protein